MGNIPRGARPTAALAILLTGVTPFPCYPPGVTAPMASVTLVRTISFSIYQRSKYAYSDWLRKNFGIDVLGHVNGKSTYPTFWSVACFGAAGATAGSCITLIACESSYDASSRWDGAGVTGAAVSDIYGELGRVG